MSSSRSVALEGGAPCETSLRRPWPGAAPVSPSARTGAGGTLAPQPRGHRGMGGGSIFDARPVTLAFFFGDKR